MRVLVTGGTGFIGAALVARLLARGDIVRLLARRPESAPKGAEALRWEAGAPLPADALADVDAVVSLAGESLARWPWTAKTKHAILASRVAGTRAVVSALAAAPRRPRVLVSASAVGYYGSRGEEILREDGGAGRGFLAEVVAAWEREAFAAEALGARVVALRNGVVLGRGGALAKLRTPFALGLGAVLGSGKQYFSWIHLEDVVGAVLWALEHEHLRGPVNGVAPQAATNRAFSRALASSLRRPLLLRAPAWILGAGLGEMGRETLLASQRAYPEKLLASGYRFRYPGLDEALMSLAGGGT